MYNEIQELFTCSSVLVPYLALVKNCNSDLWAKITGPEAAIEALESWGVPDLRNVHVDYCLQRTKRSVRESGDQSTQVEHMKTLKFMVRKFY